MDATFARVAEAMIDPGWIVSEQGLLPDDTARALAERIRGLHRSGELRPAGIGRGEGMAVREDVRGDRIRWIDPEAATPGERALLDRVEALGAHLNRELFAGIRTVELQWAAYPPGSFYRRHLDQFREVRDRVVTVLLYLNDGWEPDDGGQLRLYVPAGHGEAAVDVVPRLGTFAAFRSDLVEHEVLPCARTRFSVGGWLRRRPREAVEP